MQARGAKENSSKNARKDEGWQMADGGESGGTGREWRGRWGGGAGLGDLGPLCLQSDAHGAALHVRREPLVCSQIPIAFHVKKLHGDQGNILFFMRNNGCPKDRVGVR